jgi:hypothetical protein
VRTSFFAAAAAPSALLAALFFTAGPPSVHPAVAATAPPTPPPIGTPGNPAQPPINTPATPGPAASVINMPGVTPPPAGKPTPAPPVNARKGIEGVWEVQIQHTNTTDYTHLLLTEQGDALSGTYVDARGKKYPLAGSLEGQAVRLIVTMPNGTTLMLEGKLDGTNDMVGMLTSSDGQLPFTAAYRAKEKWIENVNPSPGGIPSQGGYTPP